MPHSFPIHDGRQSKRIITKKHARLVVNQTTPVSRYRRVAGGFRLRGSFKLTHGQLVEIILDDMPLQPVQCEVIWVGNEGSKQAGEAGLRTLEGDVMEHSCSISPPSPGHDSDLSGKHFIRVGKRNRAGRVHTDCRGHRMLATSVDWKSKREELKAKRKPLFTRYVKNPSDIRMALELKHIDDQIAECTEHMELKKGK